MARYYDSGDKYEVERYDISRSDGQPTYAGYRSFEADNIKTPGWRIYKYTYDGKGYMIRRQVVIGIWDKRNTSF